MRRGTGRTAPGRPRRSSRTDTPRSRRPRGLPTRRPAPRSGKHCKVILGVAVIVPGKTSIAPSGSPESSVWAASLDSAINRQASFELPSCGDLSARLEQVPCQARNALQRANRSDLSGKRRSYCVIWRKTPASCAFSRWTVNRCQLSQWRWACGTRWLVDRSEPICAAAATPPSR
jgi:hypothetical protein